jgi:hypothetical protein
MEYVVNSNEVELKSYKFNLVKAQKLLSKLKSYMDKNKNTVINESNYFYNISKNTISLHNENKDIIEKINKKNSELREKFVDFNRLMVEFYKFKNVIHKKNSEIGLDDILTDIDYLTGLKKIYENYVNHDDNLEEITEKHIEIIRKDSENEIQYRSDYKTFETSCFNLDEIKDKIKKINKELEELETQRDSKNAVVIVEIKFCDFTCDILGI